MNCNVHINRIKLSDFTFLLTTLIISTIALIVSLILYFGQTVPSLSSKLLAGLLLSLALTSTGNALPLTNLYLNFPNSYKIYSWAPFCIGPFAYLYVKTVLRQSIRLTRLDWLLFLPMVLYMLNRIPFYLLSNQEKIRFIQSTNRDVSLYILEPEGLLPVGWAPIFRFILLLGFIFGTIFELIIWKRKIFDLKVQIEANKDIYRFHWINTSFLLLGAIASVLGVFIQLKFDIPVSRIILFFIWIEILLICFYLLTQPKILYGMTGWIQMNEPIRSLSESEEVLENDDDISHISVHHGRNILLTILDHFNTNSPFTQMGYTIADLSKEINIPSYLISTVINQEFGHNFNEFVNDARFKYLKVLKNNDPYFDNYSLEHIGNAIGFASRTSFIAAVKKRTGLLPKEYLTQL